MDPSRETNTFSESQEIPNIVLNLKIYYHVHRSPPCAPSKPLQSSPCLPPPPSPTNFIKAHFNVHLPSMPRSKIIQNKNQIDDVHFVNMSIILHAHKKWKLKVKQCMYDHTFRRFMYNNNIKNKLLKCW